MEILKNLELCNGCHACFSACPKNSITMEENSEGFLFPKIDAEKCNSCGICKKTCPMNKSQIERTGETKLPKAFAVSHKDEEILMASSSGGAFTLLAEPAINQGGVVFGARWNEKLEVVHDYTETIEGLGAFRYSKSVQSRIGDTYKQVKDFLLSGRKVLFTGLPCQIGGLKAYLQKDYENLICVDLICRGVPSPKVWRMYIEYREKKQGAKIEKVDFRIKKDDDDESLRWAPGIWGVLYVFDNGTRHIQQKRYDLFKIADKTGLASRKSCFICGFKAMNRISDITIADFWGVEKIMPEAYNEKGTSLVLVHSAKGQEVFDKVKTSANFAEVAADSLQKNIQQHNETTIRSRHGCKKRSMFFKNLDILPFDKLVERCLYISFVEKTFCFALRGLRKVKRMILQKMS